MSAELVNLRLHRKRVKRAEEERRAEANRARFGTPKSERERLDAERKREALRLDAHKRDE